MTRAEIVAAVLKGYGKESASVIAARHGMTRNAVIGLWHRARKAGRISEPKLHIHDKIWAALVAAGDEGCTVEQLAKVVYGASRPQAWKGSLRCQVQRANSVHGSDDLALRSEARASGLTYIVGKPRPEAPSEAPQAAASPVVVEQKPVPARTISRPVLPRIAPRRSIVLQDLSGAAKATFDADSPARTCRWPKGDPREDSFRFCGEVVENPIVVDREGQSRVQPYCEACRARAFQPRLERHRPAVLAHAAFAAPRQVKAGAVRFGRAG